MRTRFFRCQLPLMFSCGLLPIPVVLCHLLGGEALLPWLVVPAAYLLFSVICLLIPGKWRLIPAVPALAFLIGGNFLVIAETHIAARIFLMLMYSVLFLCTLPIAGWERGREPALFVTASCVIAHLLAQFILFANPPSLPVFTPLLNAAFIVFLLLMMLSFNRQSMASAMPESHSVPSAVRKRNRLLTYLMMGLVMLLSLIPVLGKAVNKAMEWLKLILKTILEFLLAIFAQEETSSSSGGSQEEMLAGLGDGRTGTVAKILEQILLVIAFILMAVAIYFAIRFLWKKLKAFIRLIYNQLRHYANTASEDYVDEVEDTRDQGGQKETLTQKIMRRRSARRNLKELAPREQIRTRYGLLRGKHPEWLDSGTARETLSESSAKIYEKARYSSHEITEKDSEAFAAQQGH